MSRRRRRGNDDSDERDEGSRDEPSQKDGSSSKDEAGDSRGDDSRGEGNSRRNKESGGDDRRRRGSRSRRRSKPRDERRDKKRSPAAEIEDHRLYLWRYARRLSEISQTGVIWGVFFFVLWLLRDFFPLVFLTFVFCFVSSSGAKFLGKYLPKFSWKSRVSIVFATFLLLWTGFILLLVPQIRSGYGHLRDTSAKFPTRWTEELEPALLTDHAWYSTLLEWLDQAPEAQAGAEPEPTGDPKDGGLPVEPKPPVENADASSTEAGEPEAKERKLLELPAVKRSLEHGQEWLIANTPSFIGGTVTIATGILSLLFLSTLFSYLIVLDLDGLRREVTKLTETKLNQFYKETGSNIAKFGEVLGKVLEAQAMIACANALLTGIGLWLFGLEHVIFLSLIVFVCGFVPVAGVFLSSAPICLLGLYQGGPGMMVLLIAFIIGIHFVEAYFLNPRIMGAALKVNPVLTLVILVVGHHAMGVWGMLLGLPLCYYFFTHVIKKEDRDIGLWVRLET